MVHSKERTRRQLRDKAKPPRAPEKKKKELSRFFFFFFFFSEVLFLMIGFLTQTNGIRAVLLKS